MGLQDLGCTLLNLEIAVEQGFCGKSECERQGTASRQWP